MVVFYSTGCANEYALEECKKAIENVANAAVTSSSPVAPVSIAVLPEEEPRSFVIVGKTIPTAYLVALDSKISHDDYIIKEVRDIFDRTPMRCLCVLGRLSREKIKKLFNFSKTLIFQGFFYHVTRYALDNN